MALKKIISFGYRHYYNGHALGDCPVDGPDTVVVDVRAMFRNPFHDKTLRHLRGTDKAVQDDILQTPDFIAKYKHIRERITVPGIETAFIGCSGGHHRSVFLAELLGQELGVPVEHRNIDTP